EPSRRPGPSGRFFARRRPTPWRHPRAHRRMPPVSAPEPQASPPLPGSRRLYRLETLVFLLVLLPWMGFALAGASPERLDFALVAVVIMLHDLALTALALYLVWRGGEGLGAIGWSGRKAGREALLGVALFVPLFAAVALIQVLLRAAGCAEPSPPPAFLLPDTAEERALALLFLPVVAVAEETVFRGYLLHRLCQASGSRAVAVVLSTVIFAFRSEEHTSELQSRENLVCRLLLEKK